MEPYRIEYRYQDQSYRQKVKVYADGYEFALSQKVCPVCRWFHEWPHYDCTPAFEWRMAHWREDYDNRIADAWLAAFPQDFHGPEFYTHCADCKQSVTLSQMEDLYFCGCLLREERER